MKRLDFLYAMTSPVQGAILEKWPKGQIFQYWAENPKLYSSAANHHDAFHTYLGGHMGIDIAGPHQTPILAAHDGIITKTHGERTKQGGLEVWLESEPLDDEEPCNSKVRTLYCHLDAFKVKEGQKVYKGQIIGLMGNTGMVVSGGNIFWGNAPPGVGTHLHFGLYEFKKKGKNWIPRYINVLKNSSDPLPYITETPQNPQGNMAGLAILLNNMLRFLLR